MIDDLTEQRAGLWSANERILKIVYLDVFVVFYYRVINVDGLAVVLYETLDRICLTALNHTYMVAIDASFIKYNKVDKYKNYRNIT